MASDVRSAASANPALAPHSSAIASAIQSGRVRELLEGLPAAARPQAEHVATGSFAAGLNLILLVAAIIALTAGVISFATIRNKDLAASRAGEQ